MKIQSIFLNKYFLYFNALIFFFLNLFSCDFGKYKVDYYQAHLRSMRFLHSEGPFIDLVRDVPASASGVLPLWIYGFFDTYTQHYILSLFFYFSVVLLIYFSNKSSLKDSKILIISSLLISPSVVSATIWNLPEVFSLLVVLFIILLPDKFAFFRFLFALIIPFCRQTFAALSFYRLFFSKNIKANLFLVEVALTLTSLLFLIYIWGGIVPKSRAEVHLTPSYKSFYLSILIFSLYFFFDNLEKVRHYKFNFFSHNKKNLLIFFISFFLTALNLFAQPLYGGGFIFSRLEGLNVFLYFPLELFLIYFFFKLTSINVIFFVIFASLTFSTTNFLFMKYTDFYIFIFLGYTLMNEFKNNDCILRYCRSIYVFEFFYLLLALIYY
jgi:hypothetical protein